jgi:chemotaxis protein MotB
MRWLLTYADMITLLLLFFIVLYTMSNLDVGKYKEIAQSLRIAFGGGQLPILSNSTLTSSSGMLEFNVIPETTQKQYRTNMHFLYNKAISFLKKLIINNTIQLTTNERGFLISLNSDLYFKPTSAALTYEMYPTIQVIADFLQQMPNKVIIEGHTDDIPVNTNEFKSNWDLSAARAINILKTLEEYGVASDRLSAAAYGEQNARFSNDTEEGRAKNRRIDIVIIETPINP